MAAGMRLIGGGMLVELAELVSLRFLFERG